MATPAQLPIDESKLNAFLGQAIGEMGAAMNAALFVLGDKLGLYKAMAGAGPMTSAQVATKTRLERKICPRMAFGASRGRIFDLRCRGQDIHASTGAGFCARGGGQSGLSSGIFLNHFIGDERRSKNRGRLSQRQRRRLARARSRCFFTAPRNSSGRTIARIWLSEWIPALEGVEAKLKAGAKVADVGCGLGTSTVLMAQAYPKSTFRWLRLS